MKIEFDNDKFIPVVTLTESEIKRAFASEENYIKLLHDITCKCYGEYVANWCFPLGGKEE